MKRCAWILPCSRPTDRCVVGLTTFWLTLALAAVVCAQPGVPPANDEFINAQSLSGGSGAVTGTLAHATWETGEPLLNENPGISVWYRWTPPIHGAFYFTAASGELSPPRYVEVFTGASPASLTPVPRDGSRWLVTTDNVYFIRIADLSSGTGFSLAWATEMATADFFRDSARLRGWSGTTNGLSNRHATWEHGEPAANAGGRSIWFYWVAPASGTAIFDTVGSNFDTLLAAYRLRPRYWLSSPFAFIANIEFLAVSDDINPAFPQSRVTFSVDAGREYFVAVDGHDGATGDLTLNWNFEPDPTRRPDLIVRAAAMAPTISVVSNVAPTDCIVQHGCLLPGTRRLLRFGTATRNVGNADLYLGGISNLVYEYHPCHSHSHLVGFADHRLITNGGALVVAGLKASFCLEDGSRWDTNAIEVQRYSCGGQGIQMGWEDFYGDSLPCQWVDITGVPPGLYTLEIEVDPDNQLPELNETNNTARVQVTIPPSPFTHVNDHFQTARILPAASIIEIEGNNHGATSEPGEPPLGGGHSVWFQWTAPSNGPAAFETFSRHPTFDTVLGVYTGDSVSNLTQVAVNDDARPGTKQSRVRFNAVEGTAYYIALAGAGGSEGGFTLRLWFGGVPYDDFGNAVPYDSTARFSNVNATKQPDEPNHAGSAGGRSVWFSYENPTNPPVTSPVTITTQASDFDTLLAIYTGTTFSNLAEVANNDNFGSNRWSQVTFHAVPGATYWVAVDGVDGDSGELSLDFRLRDSIFGGTEYANGTLQARLVWR